MSDGRWPEKTAPLPQGSKRQGPGHRVRILVVDRDPSTVAALRSILRGQDWEVINALSAGEALEKARLEGPDAVLTELALDDMSGADLCRALHQRGETAGLPVIVLSASSGVAERVASLRAGASDYLVKPPDAQELIARLKAALDLRAEKVGFVVAVLGSKGGVGASVVAANLAVALRYETHARVALLDAALDAGTADIMLNLQAMPGVGNLLPRLEELEQADFEAILTSHVSGLEALLLGDHSFRDMRPEEMRKILLTLRRMRDLVVVDTHSWLGGNAEVVLELADRVAVVLTPDIPALRGAKDLVERARHLGLSRERTLVVLNRYPQRGGLPRRDIENTLGMTVQVAVPDDGRLVTYNTNRGVPAVESHRRSGVARQVRALARDLAKAAHLG